MKVELTLQDATERAVFLTNANGYDVAMITRLDLGDNPNTPEPEFLTGEQWQGLIDQIAEIFPAPPKKELTHTELIEALRLAAPSVSITTEWEHDDDCAGDWRELSRPGNCFHGEDRDDWECWQSTVTARAIVNGEMIEGEDYLGGTWEKYGDNPAKTNPDISGYFPGMALNALTELQSQIPAGYRSLAREINAALELL
jgi:hypothetical protein